MHIYSVNILLMVIICAHVRDKISSNIIIEAV